MVARPGAVRRARGIDGTKPAFDEGCDDPRPAYRLAVGFFVMAAPSVAGLFAHGATCVTGEINCLTSPMTLVELVHTSALAQTSPYAYAAITPSGRLEFTAGACPLDAEGAAVSPGDVAAQATQVMANLAVALDAAGVGLTDVAKTTVFVASTQRDDLVTAWRVIRAAFGGHEVPSRLQGVMVLGYPEKLVEVRAIAVAAASSGAAVTR